MWWAVLLFDGVGVGVFWLDYCGVKECWSGAGARFRLWGSRVIVPGLAVDLAFREGVFRGRLLLFVGRLWVLLWCIFFQSVFSHHHLGVGSPLAFVFELVE